MEEKKILDTKYFIISQKENNLFENKDNVNLILGKCEVIGIEKDGTMISKQKRYRIFQLRANSGVDINFYYKLLVEKDFSDSDFKKIYYEDLKNLIKKEYVVSSIFSDESMELNKYIKEKI